MGMIQVHYIYRTLYFKSDAAADLRGTVSSSSSISFTEHLDLIPAYFSDFVFFHFPLISLSFKHGIFFLIPLKQFLYLDHSFLPGYLLLFSEF